MNGRGQWWVGAIIIGLGVLLLLNNLGFIDVSIGSIISNYWPVVFVIWGMQFLFSRKSKGEVVTGLILIAIGLIFLGNKHDWFNIDLSFFWKLFWPVILIIIGINFLRGPKTSGKNNWAFLGGIEKSKQPWKLEDGDYWAVLGGIELDLRKAILENREYTISCNALLGGIELIVPKNITVICEGTAVLGGVEMLGEETGGIVSSMKVEQIADPGAPVLKIHCRATLGGVEVTAKD
ncbi:cell wall-active antibiotics response protein [Desulfuribacillus alkaliarsenatis]|uniref:Cell wall-active antibiotics response LiaF-like C-terminal domain-containing protein n=1 Tax=Desulfuribacillus alkaliarsenatis TaxID=766136 RepID=A0A1E5G1A6_9FIRM|nr:cell wall-active antibiotics response protein [Desulfuribacillus alkaliarsenatis]OEF96694.1 hypothetical protein BHF68_06360 [Desulfuribacillus alkaliarsenatis]